MKHRCFSWLVLLVGMMAGPLNAQDKSAPWPQFRGPGGQGISSEQGLPTTWGPGENIAWTTELPGPGTSSPIVVGERIFLTCYTGFNVPGQSGGNMEALKLHVVCLDRQKGKLLWTKTVAPRLPEQTSIREGHGYASSTPVADHERVYVFFGRSGVLAFDHDGNETWRAQVGDKLNGWGSAASPILHGDLLIVNASVESDALVAFDKRTGKEQWRASGVREAWNTPVVVSAQGRSEIIVPILGKILAFDPATGQQLWFCRTDISWYMVPSVVTDGDMIYCIGGRSGGALAVRAGGSGDVTQTRRVWKGTKGSNVSSPVLHKGYLYWMNDNLGIAYCAEADTGKIVYEERIDRAGQVYASAVLGDGKIYYVSRSGPTFVLAAEPKFQVLAVNDLEPRGRFDASPAIADGRLLIRSHRNLYCVGKK